MDSLPDWFASVREWCVPRWGGFMCRWDCGDGEQQFGVDAWIGAMDTVGSARLDAAAALGVAMRECGVKASDLKPLPAMEH